VIRLRQAVVADAERLRRWDRAPHVVAGKYTVLPAPPAQEGLAAAAAGHDDDDWCWDVELARTVPRPELLIGEHDGRPVGFVQIIDPALEESHYWGDCAPDLRAIDIWLGEPEDLGRGYGTEIMRQALARCFAPPEVTAVIIDPIVANVRAIRFYERLGFEHVDDRHFGTDHCAVHQLVRARWQG
jgi:aminoglycoside 6'-N-acetyltransferase